MMNFEGFTGSSQCMAENAGAVLSCEERARQREIISYLSAASFPTKIPIGHPGTGNCKLSSDATLNQLVQLGPLRLGCDRAIFSFIDHEYEYIVAESTRLHTPAQRRADIHPDVVVGVAKLELDHGVCPQMIPAFTDETGESDQYGPYVWANRNRYFVSDFREAPLYMKKQYVSEFKPGMISLVGVPITSPLGYVLGAYMVGDSKVSNLDQEEVIDILQETSTAIMAHLDLVRAQQNRGRSEKLMKGLAEFMERDSPVPHERSLSMSTRATSEAPTQSERALSVHEGEDVETPGEIETHGPWPKPHTAPSYTTTQTSDSGDVVFSPRDGGELETPPSTPPEGNEQNPFDIRDNHGDNSHAETQEEDAAPLIQEATVSDEVRKTFGRAADVIREAMNMDGLMFIDAVPNGFSSRSNTTTPYERVEDPFVSDTAESNNGSDLAQECPLYLAKSVNPRCEKPENAPKDGHCPVPEALLQRWIRRFPRGHIFSADEHGPIDCRYGPGNSIKRSSRMRRRSSRVLNDAADLFEHFPHVRYIIFLPLWHFQRECWFAAAFGWVSFESTQAIDASDINLLSAFGNSVMAEVSRIEALSVSRAKSDFISSISHELRSPLHGILASGELLRESLDDPSLLSLIDMIDSCGTTLLDTFNNLLDYAKINNSTRAEKSDDEHNADERKIRKLDNKPIDLSVLVQDVVEAVNMGHMSKTAFHGSVEQRAVFTTLAELAQAEEEFPDASVIVTMNIEKRPSWQTKVDVGAWKRVVMNIVGNALKYTRQGHIEVGLKIVDITDEKKRNSSKQNICLSVRDTGIGMSADYLKYQLFTPFAQENNLSPGTGLGLSIVQQIVRSIGGKLDVQSQIGVGTHVKVCVPLNSDTAGPLGQQMPPIDEHSQFDADGRLHGRTLHVITPEAYKALVNPQFEINSEVRDRARAMRSALRHIAGDTLGMKVVYDVPTENNEADVYFFDAYIIGKVMHGKLNCSMHSAILRFSPLIVMCSGAGPLNHLKNEKLKGQMLHLRHPIGPKKLAGVLLNALDVGKIAKPCCPNEFLPTPPPVPSTHLKEDTTEPAYHPDPGHANGHDPDHHAHRTEPSPLQYTIHLAPSSSISSPAILTGNPKPTHHLLLVDDNPINLKILTTLVKKLNHTYETASNGLEAVQLYRASLQGDRTRFSWCFMDISMPVMNGFEATREIRKIEKTEGGGVGNGSVGEAGGARTCKIAALTGLGSEMSRQEAFASGTNLFLTKPVKLGEIRALLTEEESAAGKEVK